MARIIKHKLHFSVSITIIKSRVRNSNNYIVVLPSHLLSCALTSKIHTS